MAPDTASADSQNDDIHVKESELDREGFDAQKYVQEVLRREGLEGVLRTEGELLSGMCEPFGAEGLAETRGRYQRVGWGEEGLGL